MKKTTSKSSEPKQYPKFLLTHKSKNQKTGLMSVSTSPFQTCPVTCPFLENGCYANAGPLKFWWSRCSDSKEQLYTGYLAFLERVKNEVPEGEYWRHNQAGDLLPLSDRERIDRIAALRLASANKGKRGYTYTHFGVIEQKGTSQLSATHNREVVEEMNSQGFVVNVSTNNMEHADLVLDSGINAPVSTILPEVFHTDKIKRTSTPSGRTVITCPATIRDDINCKQCGLCMNSNRETIIGFPAHGHGKRVVENVIETWRP